MRGASRTRPPGLHALLALVAALAVAAAGGTLLAEHTDDGCRTETHCLVCRSVESDSAAVAVEPARVGAGLPAAAAHAEACPPARSAEPRTGLSRGPPAPTAPLS